MVTDEFEEGRPKSVVVPQNIDAMRELRMQDRHVTYREKKTSLDISMCHKRIVKRLIRSGARPTVLQEVFEGMRKNNRQHRIILHHDNAGCHTSVEKTQFLESEKIKLTGHPSYNRDLTPKDFYIFPSVRNKLRGYRF
ncbi:Mariner Mos1 transposase [Eumeta japonica]|uniref:Mariner Mos1 transposase n=1 Tax=Eumeta variegata TaxID=151549 RepID=A0A4C1TG10_EUMVA|nr:Mariner Mos1 transposase [Eumeta japonica]